MKKLKCWIIIFIFSVNLLSCGTIMYPERKGQISGKIDHKVAILDGIGLLFFLIPGIIAFAVDFSNGTIYLPGKKANSGEFNHNQDVIHANRKIDLEYLESLLRKKYNTDFNLKSSDVLIQKINSLDHVLLFKSDVSA